MATRASMSDRDRALDRMLGMLRSRIALMTPAFMESKRDMARFGLTLEDLLDYAKHEALERS
jgi:hypothetical protein